MSNRPLITVAMPVWNCADTISVAIRSVLSQSVSDFELLVYDDGGSDGTAHVVAGCRDPRVTLIRDAMNLGVSARLNDAIERGRGEYLARMDGDDLSYPERFERQLEMFESDRALDLVGAGVLVFQDGGRAVGKRPGRRIYQKAPMLRTVPIAHPTFFGRMSWFRRFKYSVPGEKSHCQDQFLLLQAARFSKYDTVDDLLLGYRENRLSLCKQARTRWSYFKAASGLRHHIGSVRTAALLAGQVAKLLLDAASIATHSSSGVLRNRAEPLTSAESERWAQIWSECNQESLL